MQTCVSTNSGSSDNPKPEQSTRTLTPSVVQWHSDGQFIGSNAFVRVSIDNKSKQSVLKDVESIFLEILNFIHRLFICMPQDHYTHSRKRKILTHLEIVLL